MRTHGVYPSAVSEARALLAGGATVSEALAAMYTKPSGAPDGLGLALLRGADVTRYAEELAPCLAVPADELAAAATRLTERAGAAGPMLTGAEATAMLVAGAGCEIVFAYPGTSELAVCDAFARHPSTRLVNARGDKEAAFMAAGASVLAPGRGVSVLHGARGLTNAAGGIADARRGECASLAVVGLPSTTSAEFLPPHGEHGLLEGVGRFAKSWYELPGAVGKRSGDPVAAEQFAAAFAAALADVAQRPYGPVLLGLPQDVAQQAWLPYDALAPARGEPPAPSAAAIDVAASAVAASERIVVLVDDYLLRYPDAEAVLADFCARTGAVVLQVFYQRGPMLFDRLSAGAVPSFLGWLRPADADQQRLLHEADLLVTLEDRNMYQRVVGDLPACQKVAINSDATKVLKNGYLRDDDILLEGDAVDLLRGVTAQLAGRRPAWTVGAVAGPPPERRGSDRRRIRDVIGAAFAATFASVERPMLVDDGQMFGGMLAESHDRFPANLRIFGDHGGFVGGGIAFATGLALAERGAAVVCSLGDQGFGNGLQGLVAAVEQSAPVVFVMCNNGGSVSLLKQAKAARERIFDDGGEPFLSNAPVDPVAVAAGLGLRTDSLDFSSATADALPALARRLEAALATAIAARAPYFVELRLPADDETWEGIWLTGGYDETARATARQTVGQPA